MSENDFDRKWLDLLVCPKTGQELTYDRKKKIITNQRQKNFLCNNGWYSKTY